MEKKELELLSEILKWTKARFMIRFGQLNAELKDVETQLECLKKMEKDWRYYK